jgi:asparagine synthetase B (glutamine-hydrolysing)
MNKKFISDYEIFLYLSYIPNWSEAGLAWLNCDFDCEFGDGVEDEAWWVNEGVKALKNTMAEQIAVTDNRVMHVIPLSGGLDSRAILGGLLENLPGSQIVSATYGIPGAWDFEIAKLITRKFGIRHEVFDLTNEKWDVDELIKAASNLRYPVSVHQYYVRRKINDHFGEDCVYWSGLMGDSLAGSYLPKTPNTDKRKAVGRFVNTAPTPNYKSQLFQDEMIEVMLDKCPWNRLYNKKFTLDQQIDMGVRQNFLHRPIVIVDGFDFKTPFLTQTWGNFMINVPYKWLLDFYLYKRIITESYKELSRLPARGNAGMPIPAPKAVIVLGKVIQRIKPYIIRRDQFYSDPRTNYINWTASLRHRGSFQDSIYTTLQDLKMRQIFDDEDLDSWWQDHLDRKTDYTTLLMNLSSLELLIKVGLL